MVPHSAATGAPHPDAIEFVRFCYHRRRAGWPELYDEMCAVAGRGLFRGLSAEDLGGIGVGLSLFDMPALVSLAARVVAEEMALRRPASVVIAEASGIPSDPAVSADHAGLTPAPTAVPQSEAMATSLPVHATEPTAPMTPLRSAEPALPVPSVRTAKASEERSFDVPIRVALAPSGV